MTITERSTSNTDNCHNSIPGMNHDDRSKSNNDDSNNHSCNLNTSKSNKYLNHVVITLI